MQRPHKENEAFSGGKTKCGKSIKFDGSVKEANIMNHDDPIPKKNKEKKARKRKSESAKLDPEDVGNAYGIDHLKIGEAKHDLYESE